MKKNWDILHTQERQRLVEDELRTPEGYFDTLENSIFQRISSDHEPLPSYFDTQQKQLLALAKITAIEQGVPAPFRVPDNYFAQAEERILSQCTTHERQTKKVVWLRPIVWSSAAATIAVLLAMYWLNKPSPAPGDFEQLLAAAELSENDLEWIGDADDLADYYLALDEPAAQDSILPDSLHKKAIATDSLAVSPAPPQIKQGVPPKKVDWDAITDEEIMEYLMESGDADEWME